MPLCEAQPESLNHLATIAALAPCMLADMPVDIKPYVTYAPSTFALLQVFGNKLAIKDGWGMSDHPYFAAPGTVEAPVGNVSGPISLPPITMAFCIVENGKGYLGR